MSEEKQVVLAWIPPYAPETKAFLKVSSRVAENLLKYTSIRYQPGTEEEYERFAAEVAAQKPVIQCHKGAMNEGMNGLTRWEKRDGTTRHCTYCGSLHPEDLLALLKEGGRLERSDFKYGYPHKFYVTTKSGQMLKWYNKHFLDMLDERELFTALADSISTQTAIEFVLEDREVKYAVHSLARGWSEDHEMPRA